MTERVPKPKGSVLRVQLNDFSSVEQRESLLEETLSANVSTVVFDALNLKQGAGYEEFNQVLFFAKLLSERIRRYGGNTPTIKIIKPDSPFVLDPKRVDELRRISGLKIEII